MSVSSVISFHSLSHQHLRTRIFQDSQNIEGPNLHAVPSFILFLGFARDLDLSLAESVDDTSLSLRLLSLKLNFTSNTPSVGISSIGGM